MAKPKVARPKTDEKYTSPQAGVVQNNSNRALELGETYRRLGGTDTALLPNYARMNPLPDASIPVLERAILDTANTLQGRASINRTGDKQPLDMSNVSPLNAFLQGATGLNRASERNRLQQTDRAVDEIRNARTEQILSDIGQSDRFNSFREHPILAEQSLVGLLTGRTSLTPEMREAGLTQTDINTYLDEIKNEGIRTGSRELAEDHPALATAASIGLNPLYSLTNSVKNVGNYIAGNPLENYVNPANELRQNVSEGIDSKVGQFAYNVGNSAADMITAMLLPGSAAGTMGLEKASEVINGAVDRGLTPDQILAEGIGSGVTTAATEAIPLGRFSQGGNIFGAMLAEGLQEGSEDIADTILDQLVTQLGGNANRSELITQLRAYLDAGYSPDDAVNAVKTDYFKQLGLDVLAGGITGGLMGAGSNALQGRNIITGNIPTLNNETQTEANETVPEVAQPEAQPVEQQTVNEAPLTEDEEVHNAEQRIMNFVYGLQRGTVADPRAEYNNVLADVEAVKAKYPNSSSWLDTMLFINQPTINQKLNLFQPEVREETQPVEALNSPLENAQQMVDNFSNSLKNGSIQSREQASQGLQNISQALNAIAEQNPEIRSDIKTIWDNFIQSITPQRNQPTNEVGNIVRANPENVVYHAGTFSRLNKAETNGRFAGSNRDTGYFGTGHYFVDNNTLSELNQGGYKEKPLTSVDISGYNNLFRADTDEKARKLHKFLSDMTRYTQGSDRNTLEEIYQEYMDAFKGQNNILSYEEFENRINDLVNYMRNSNLDDRGDSVSTQFMKSLGYGGVDTRGTRYADTRYGTVIYDVNEDSVLQSNIPTLQRESTDMLTRNENRNVFDAEEDARIQGILDTQAKNAAIEARANELFDGTELNQNEETLKQLYNNRKEVQDIINNINSVMNNPEEYVDEMERDYIDLGFDPFTDDERINRINETLTSFGQSLDERTAELASIESQIAELEARNNELYQEYRKAWEQAREEIENPTSTSGFSREEPAPILTQGTVRISDNYIDIDGYSKKKSEKALLNELAKVVEKYDKAEADNLKNAVKFNEITQYPASADSDYILEWEEETNDAGHFDENGNYVVDPANYYVHIRFPKAAQSETLTDRQITEYRSRRDAIKSNLAMFKGTKKLQNRLDKAFSAIEQNQPNAVENFNNVVNEINEEMAGETVGVSQRDVMSDLYRDMKEVTDGYKIRVSKDAIRQLGLSSDTYNELKNRLYTGKNSITFVEKGGTPIDSAYMEMYDQAHGSLPSPQNMAEGDLLKALYKYITDAKSSRGETTMETAWEDIPVNATTPLNRGQDLINGFYNKMRSGKATGVDTYDLQEKIIDIIKQNPEYKEELAELCNKAIDDFWNNGIDPEVANLNTVEDVQNATDEEMEQWNSRPFDLEYFREIEDEAIPTLDEDEYHSGVFKTSKFTTNTAPNSEIMTEEQIDEIIPEDVKNYEAVTHEGTLNAAERNVRENGFKGTFANLKSKEQWDAVNTDEAMLCFKRAADEANALEKRGQNSKDAWKRAVDIFKEIRERATVGGQMIEALKKWSIKTPEGKLAQAIAYATDATKSGTDNDSWLGQLKDLGKVEKFTFSDEFVEEFLKKAHEYDGQDITDGQQARLDQELAHMVLDQIPRTFREKFTSLWMDNLLASVRTLFTRNVGGNTGKALLDQTITKWVSGGVDKAAARLTGSRTTTGFTLKGLQTYLKGAKEGAINTTRDYWLPTSDPDAEQTFSQLLKDIKSLNKEDVKANIFAEANVSNRKGSEGDFKETLRNNRTSFDSKPLKLYDKIIKFGLAFSDNPFFRGTYEQTYEELQQLRKEGLIPEVSDERFEPWAKACAVAQGLEAVYQDNSKLAEGASKIKQGLSDMSEGYVGADILSGAAMPFVRTPMNVVRSNLEYSPLGVAKNLLATIKEVRANLKEGRNAFDTKNFKQERFVRETSRNIVGTLMFAMGLMMKGAGFLTGGYSDNDKERQAQKESGMQEYALVNPLNGNQYSINWIPGLGANWVSASAFEDAFSRPDQTVGEALGSGIKEGSASMFEQAALQGLQRLTGATNYNSDSIIDNVVQTVANTASSAVVPSFVRQTAAALDPYKRDTFSGDVYEDILDNAINGIPFLRQQLLEPRIGSNGQPMVQNPGRNTAQKWFDNLVNPAMVTSPSAVSDPVREEAMRLFSETRSYDAFQPYNKMDYLEVGDHVPTREEFAEFQQRANTAMNEIASNMIESDFYQGLDAVDQQTILKNIYDAVRQGERAEILGLDENDLKGAAKVYFNEGEEGLINYLTAGSALNQMGLNNNPSYRDQIIETLNQGGTEAVEQMVSDSQDLSALGFSDNMVFKYNHAQQYIPTLNPQSFSDLYHAIDTEDPEKESIKQSELLAYLNQNPASYDYDTVMSYWNAFGSWQRTPHFDENSGTWKV